MAKKRKKTSKKTVKKATKKSAAKSKKKVRVGTKKAVAKKSKRKVKAKPPTIGERLASAYHAVVDTVKGTDELRNKLEQPGTSETE